MRDVRPTFRVLAMLPLDDFGDTSAQGAIERAKAVKDPEARKRILNEITLEGLTHPLLDDARQRLNTGKPDRHEAATREFGRTVYEVRSRTGAAWRGAVILDDAGDPWLVYAERHNQFHTRVGPALRKDKAKDAPKNLLEPSVLDYDVRNLEDERAAELQLELDLIGQLLEGLKEAVESRALVTKVSPEDPDDGSTLTYEIHVEHGDPAKTPDLAHETGSEISVTYVLRDGSHRMRELLLRTGILLIQPDQNLRDEQYLLDGRLRVELIVTHAKLAQLIADVAPQDVELPLAPTPPTHLHYVNKDQRTHGFVAGHAIQALCGHSFVPTKSEEAGLPLCPKCEQIEGVTQSMLDFVRDQKA